MASPCGERSSCARARLRRRLDALDALADADARTPVEDLAGAAALVVQAGEGGLEAVDGDRARPAERAERELAELAEGEHDGPRHAHDRPRAAGEAEHVFLG